MEIGEFAYFLFYGIIIEESYQGVIDDTGTDIELPNIPTLKGTSILKTDTTIQPSNLEVVYKGKR